MWSAAFISFAIFILIGTEDPITYKTVAFPFLVASLSDVEDLYHPKETSLVDEGIHVLDIHAINFITILMIVSKIARILCLLWGASPCVKAMFTTLSSWSLFACTGAVVHFALQLMMRSHSPLLCIGMSLLISGGLLGEYMLLLRRDEEWKWLHGRIVAVTVTMNLLMVIWLSMYCVVGSSADYSSGVLRNVNSTFAVFYVAVVFITLCIPPPSQEAPTIEMNSVHHG